MTVLRISSPLISIQIHVMRSPQRPGTEAAHLVRLAIPGLLEGFSDATLETAGSPPSGTLTVLPDGQASRHARRAAGGQTGRQAGGRAGGQPGRQPGIQLAGRQPGSQAGWHSGAGSEARQPGRQAGSQAASQPGRQSGSQAARQPGRPSTRGRPSSLCSNHHPGQASPMPYVSMD